MNNKENETGYKFSSDQTLEKIREIQAVFCRERDWDQFHPPRDVLFDMVGEVGELAEIFRYKGHVEVGLPEFSKEERDHVGQEMSDVLLSLVRLAERCHIDLPTAVLQKFQLNREKYPVHRAYGKINKLTENTAEKDEKTDTTAYKVPERKRGYVGYRGRDITLKWTGIAYIHFSKENNPMLVQERGVNYTKETGVLEYGE